MRSTGNTISTRSIAALFALAVLAACTSVPKRQAPPGQFIAPLDEVHVLSSFGQRGSRPHKGIDLKADKGTPIFAVEDGIVVFSGRQRGFGRLVIIDHGAGVTTYYAHMSAIKVGLSETVRQGQTIGKVGKSGNATAFHLHFEVRDNGIPVDPLAILSTFNY